MQIKRIISAILVLLVLCGCTPIKNETIDDPIEEPTEESIYIDPISENNTIQELGVDITKKLNNYFGDANDAFIGESLNLFGKSIDFYDFTVQDIYGNDIDLSKYKNKKVLVEIAATYCNHCGENLKYMSRIKENLGDIDILQIFADKGGSIENVYTFYSEHNHKITDDAIIIPYNYELVDRIVSVGITQTPSFMFIDSGVIKTALSSFNSKFLESICKIGFTDTIKREEIVDTKGRPLEKFFRTRQTLISELNEESKNYLNILHESNVDLTAENAGVKFNFNDLTGDFDDGYIDKDSYNEYENSKTIIFGITSEYEEDLNRDIRIINEFLENNEDIKGLIVFLDDSQFFLTNTSSLYLKSDMKAICPVVSSNCSVPYQVNDIAYTYIYSSNSPMILFVENNYITGMCVGTTSLISLDRLKDMFFGPDCITLKENLNQNY